MLHKRCRILVVQGLPLVCCTETAGWYLLMPWRSLQMNITSSQFLRHKKKWSPWGCQTDRWWERGYLKASDAKSLLPWMPWPRMMLITFDSWSLKTAQPRISCTPTKVHLMTRRKLLTKRSYMVGMVWLLVISWSWHRKRYAVGKQNLQFCLLRLSQCGNREPLIFQHTSSLCSTEDVCRPSSSPKLASCSSNWVLWCSLSSKRSSDKLLLRWRLALPCQQTAFYSHYMRRHLYEGKCRDQWFLLNFWYR